MWFEKKGPWNKVQSPKLPVGLSSYKYLGEWVQDGGLAPERAQTQHRPAMERHRCSILSYCGLGMTW